jgi:hypothetical protein
MPFIDLAQLLGRDFYSGEMPEVRVITSAKNKRTFTVKIFDNTDIASLKVKIESESSIPARFQRLIYRGMVLDETMSGTIERQPVHHTCCSKQSESSKNIWLFILGSTSSCIPVHACR